MKSSGTLDCLDVAILNILLYSSVNKSSLWNRCTPYVYTLQQVYSKYLAIKERDNTCELNNKKIQNVESGPQNEDLFVNPMFF